MLFKKIVDFWFNKPNPNISREGIKRLENFEPYYKTLLVNDLKKFILGGSVEIIIDSINTYATGTEDSKNLQPFKAKFYNLKDKVVCLFEDQLSLHDFIGITEMALADNSIAYAESISDKEFSIILHKECYTPTSFKRYVFGTLKNNTPFSILLDEIFENFPYKTYKEKFDFNINGEYLKKPDDFNEILKQNNFNPNELSEMIFVSDYSFKIPVY